MEDPLKTPGTNDAAPDRLITQVETMQSPDGTAYGFSLLDEESMSPCFRLAFGTREDAEQGRTMMKEILDHCLYFEVPDGPEQPEPKPAWGSGWR
ncbi:MAG: hypothetical protein ACLPX9_21255 [Rhodomicrobium sp.]